MRAVSIGYHTDMAQMVGDTVLTSPMWNWTPKYTEIVQAIQAGTYQSESFYGHLADGTFNLAPFSPRVSAETAQLVEQRKQELIDGTFNIFQLDATAYPGNSGGPLFDPESGAVLGVVNMVLIKGTRESALSEPSGIAYAIPAMHVKALLDRHP